MSVESLSDETKSQLIAGRYELVSLLGSGRMGAVYLARDRALDHHLVALKLLKIEQSDERALRREVIACRRIKNAHVVQLFEFGTVDQQAFLVLEYVAGGTLRQLIEGDEFAALTFEERLRLFRECCLAIEAAHSKGIVHRDIKSDNVLLTEDRSVKITDFGFARLLDSEYSRSRSDDTIGTPFYMAPEQFHGQRGDVGSDIYSLGILAFELFTGQLPYPGSNFLQLAVAHIQHPLPSEGLHAAQLPRWLIDLIERCCAKERDARFRSVHELLRTIEENLPPVTLEHSDRRKAVLEELQHSERRQRRGARRRRMFLSLRNFGLPFTLFALMLLCFANDRSAGTAAIFFFRLERRLGLDLSVLARAFSVPWSITRPHEVFALIDQSELRAGPRMALRELAALGALVGLHDANGDTPLTYAARNGRREAVNTMLAVGVAPTERNRAGESPIQLAFRARDFAIISALGGWAPFERCDALGNTALQLLAQNGQWEEMLTLAKSGLIRFTLGGDAGRRRWLNFANDAGDTVLHLLARRRDSRAAGEYLSILLLLGADRNIQNNRGETPLHTSIAANYGTLSIALLETPQELTQLTKRHPHLTAGRPAAFPSLNPNLQDREGRTPLIALLDSRDISALEKLCSYSPDLQLVDNAGRSALSVARALGDPRAVALLESGRCTASGVQ